MVPQVLNTWRLGMIVFAQSIGARVEGAVVRAVLHGGTWMCARSLFF